MDNKPFVQDIEETAEELEFDTEPKWISEHKKVLFTPIDYTLNALAEQVISGELDLQPQYQRRLRWNDSRKSQLIESFLMNVPVPPVFLSEEEGGVYAVIDGKQRITAITDFLTGELELGGLTFYPDLNGKRFENLATSEQNFLKSRIPLRAIIILDRSPEDIKLETFRRVNTGGVPLNAQEIRNIAFRGALNDLIMELSELSHFHRLLGIKDKSRSAIHQHMRDAELVLRFLAFRKTWKQFAGSIKGHMDGFMEENRNLSKKELANLRGEFVRVLEVVDAAFGDRAFRRWKPETDRWRSQVVAAIYDAQMLAAQDFKVEQVEGKQDLLMGGLQALFQEDDFRESTEAATNAKKAFEYRIRAVRGLMAGVVE